MVEWLKHWWTQRPRISPNDEWHYSVDHRIIHYTIQILNEYGNAKSEGVVYWAGKRHDNHFFVTGVVAPKLKSSRYGFMTSHTSNSQFVEFICDHDLEYISQVHSHPGKWVDHSDVDDDSTAFRSEGLVSIVVPLFGRKGMIPLHSCGVHRYMGGKFYRLTNGYVRRHFTINKTETASIILKDFRHG